MRPTSTPVNSSWFSSKIGTPRSSAIGAASPSELVQQGREAGYDLSKVLTTDDLVQGDNCFFSATGITDGELLQGVRFYDFGASTQSLVMRSKSGTRRKVEAVHMLEKLSEFSAIEF